MNTKMKNIDYVVKRDGRREFFEEVKVENVVKKAFNLNGIFDEEVIKRITNNILSDLYQEGKMEQTVEHIQDVVELNISKSGYYEVSKRFCLVREERTRSRKKKQQLYQKIEHVIQETDRENANVGNSPSGKLLQIAEAASKDYVDSFLIRDEVLDAVNQNLIYLHDSSWYGVGTTTCCFIPLRKLLQEGFDTGHGYIRSPKRIVKAVQLACIIFQSNQNDQHGGQAFGWLDRDLAPYVEKEYQWQVKQIKDTLQAMNISTIDEESVEKTAWENTRNETFQAMEAFIFNLNTMHSRAGAQVPFTSINVGTDTTKEGRLITEMLFKAYSNGLGKGEQPIFPNIIFKVREGVNWNPTDPNYDLLLQSISVSTKRLFPNYLFQDCKLNRDFPEDVPVMGCRTRISWNTKVSQEEQSCEGRGNISFSTLNLVGLALESKKHKNSTMNISKEFGVLEQKYEIKIPHLFENIDEVMLFFVMMNNYSNLVIKQLLDRLAFQGQFTKSDFPFLMSKVWKDSEALGKDDQVREIIEHGSLAMGFIGLAEALKALVGVHHGESKDSLELGIEIVRFLRNKMDEATEVHGLNFGLLATPAEGLSGKFTIKDRHKHGEIEGVTNNDWYTNSFHVPVEYQISLFKKVEIEGNFHQYCNAGAISYIELKEAPTHNQEGFLSVLKHMKKNDMSYVAVNFPVDVCNDCGLIGIIDGNHCPKCNSKKISRIRRITGYLSELNNFGHAKLQEVRNRVKHD